MIDIQPVNVSTMPSSGAPINVQRTFSITGSPMPEEVFNMIKDGFGTIENEDAEAVHQFLLSKSPSSELDDIKHTLHHILEGDVLPSKEDIIKQIRDQLTNEITNKSLDEVVAWHKDVLLKELSQIQRNAEESGDWSFYLRASKKREMLDEISNTSE